MTAKKVKRQPTATSDFGAGRRESHDASPFYRRNLATVKETKLDAVTQISDADALYCHRSERMKELPDNSVALVVTSPPYHSAKLYDTEATFPQYLAMLRRVFRECHRVLEPGGRICVNVANLGRKPYIPLSDLTVAMLGKLGFLYRGQIIWIKGEEGKTIGMSGNCAWGSFRSPANPTLRDCHEYIVVFSKDRFDRALPRASRKEAGLPHVPTISAEDFMKWTLSVWFMRPESAKRVNHPAPFPVELPRRLIQLYTYEDDVVLDPFMGAGATAVAAVEANRRYVGYDLDASYLATAEERIARARGAS